MIIILIQPIFQFKFHIDSNTRIIHKTTDVSFFGINQSESKQFSRRNLHGRTICNQFVRHTKITSQIFSILPSRLSFKTFIEVSINIIFLEFCLIKSQLSMAGSPFLPSKLNIYIMQHDLSDASSHNSFWRVPCVSTSFLSYWKWKSMPCIPLLGLTHSL